jgi:hypothetical protein
MSRKRRFLALVKRFSFNFAEKLFQIFRQLSFVCVLPIITNRQGVAA